MGWGQQGGVGQGAVLGCSGCSCGCFAALLGAAFDKVSKREGLEVGGGWEQVGACSRGAAPWMVGLNDRRCPVASCKVACWYGQMCTEVPPESWTCIDSESSSIATCELSALVTYRWAHTPSRHARDRCCLHLSAERAEAASCTAAWP